MPRFPKNPLENGLNESTAIIPEQDTTEDVVSLELARMAKAKRDALKTFQTEERLDDLTSDLGAEVEQLHNDSIDKAGDGLTRKALEAIDKRIEQEASQLDEEGKQNIRENFETRRSELLKRAAHLETEARKNYYTKSLEKQAERLKEKIEKGEELNATAFSQLESKIEKADLPLDEKEEFSNLIQKEIELAESKAILSNDSEERARILEGGGDDLLDDELKSRLKSFALQQERSRVVSETIETQSQFNDFDARISQGDISFDEIEQDIEPLPLPLQQTLKMKARRHEETAKLVSSFRKDPGNTELGETLVSSLTEDKDIVSDAEASALVIGFAGQHGIVPSSVRETLRHASETTEPKRFISVARITEQLEGFVPDLFEDETFQDLRLRAELVRIIGKRYPDQKGLETHISTLLLRDPPITRNVVIKHHGDWLKKIASQQAKSDEERLEFADLLIQTLELTNGSREEALSVAEAMFPTGKKPETLPEEKQEETEDSSLQNVNRVEKEDRLPIVGEEVIGDAKNESTKFIDKVIDVNVPSAAETYDAIQKNSRTWVITGLPRRQAQKLIQATPKNIIGATKTIKQKISNSTLRTIIFAESSFDPWAHAKGQKQHRNTARGLAQFIESTWHSLVRDFNGPLYDFVAKQFGGRKKAINNPEFRRLLHMYASEPNLSFEILKAFTARNRRRILTNKLNNDTTPQQPLPVNDVTLYMMHFLGYPNGIKALRAMVNTPNDSLSKVLGLSLAGTIAGKNTFLSVDSKMSDIEKIFKEKFKKADTALRNPDFTAKLMSDFPEQNNNQWLKLLK